MKNGDPIVIRGVVSTTHEDGTAYVALPSGQSLFTDLASCEAPTEIDPETIARGHAEANGMRIVAAESLDEATAERERLGRDLDDARTQLRESEGRLETQRTAHERFYTAAREQRDSDAERIAALAQEVEALRDAPLPAYGRSDAEGYAQANGLVLIAAAELAALRAPAPPSEPKAAKAK